GGGSQGGGSQGASGNASEGGDSSSSGGQVTSEESVINSIQQSPFGRLEVVLGDEGLSQIFPSSGEGGGSNPFGGAGSSTSDSPYGQNPFAGDNFWNIFAGGVNPSNIGSGGQGGSSSGGGSPFG
ncbi:MAG TPA: hypothetical protein DEV81_01445, partial [Cyanobacteria bacterium UBA11049]|nr:hypothetical protein [Cyanobacteria bacterium UBA11049]